MVDVGFRYRRETMKALMGFDGENIVAAGSIVTRDGSILRIPSDRVFPTTKSQTHNHAGDNYDNYCLFTNRSFDEIEMREYVSVEPKERKSDNVLLK